MQELSVDRSSSLFLWLGIAGAIGFFGYVLLSDDKGWNEAVAYLVAAFAISMSVMFVWTETRERPALHIGKEGIRDNVGGLRFIRWDEIETIELVRSKYPALGLKLRDPAKFGVSDGFFASAKRALASNGYTPIDIGMLKTTSDEVMAAASHFFALSRSNGRAGENTPSSMETDTAT
jgi:hypothetical protein